MSSIEVTEGDTRSLDYSSYVFFCLVYESKDESSMRSTHRFLALRYDFVQELRTRDFDNCGAKFWHSKNP